MRVFRGTIYFVYADDDVRRFVLELEADSAQQFEDRARLRWATETRDRNPISIEFGPIGEPWRK